MALRPGILLNPKTPDVGKTFASVLSNVRGIDALRENRANQPLRNRLLESQTTQSEQQAQQERETARITSIAQGALELQPAIRSGDVDAVRSQLLQRKTRLVDQGLPTNDTDEALAMLDQPGGLAQLSQSVQGAIDVGTRMGILDQSLTTAQRNVATETEGFSPEDVMRSKRIAAGLDPRASASGDIDLFQQKEDIKAAGAGEREAAILAERQRGAGAVEEEKEGGKLRAQIALKPQIERAVIKARTEAKAKGEAFTDLTRMQAALPGLRDTVDQLKDLALIATSTLGGRVFDTAVKELGFGATTGGTALAKFIGVVNNQVLPLLKPTFGGSFSVQEGESLKATMGDPNATPEEKLAQLDAFIGQKERDIVTKDQELRLLEADRISDEDLFK